MAINRKILVPYRPISGIASIRLQFTCFNTVIRTAASRLSPLYPIFFLAIHLGAALTNLLA